MGKLKAWQVVLVVVVALVAVACCSVAGTLLVLRFLDGEPLLGRDGEVCGVGCDTACATPIPDRRPVCTPPACGDDEVYHCQGDCPGGCGTICVTPTPTIDLTPRPMCTPPACGEDEVYFCPGDCPGGCGTVCATPTPVE